MMKKGKVFEKLATWKRKRLKFNSTAEYYLNDMMKKELETYYKWLRVKPYIKGDDYLFTVTENREKPFVKKALLEFLHKFMINGF